MLRGDLGASWPPTAIYFRWEARRGARSQHTSHFDGPLVVDFGNLEEPAQRPDNLTGITNPEGHPSSVEEEGVYAHEHILA